MQESRIINGGVSVDDRGSVRFINDFDPLKLGVRRFYQIENHKRDFIRSFHSHLIEGKYAYVIKGTVLVCIAPVIEADSTILSKEIKLHNGKNYMIDDSKKQLFVLSSVLPKVLYIPPGYTNGFKSLEENTIIQFFSTSTLEESKGDDIRFSWNAIDVWEEDYR
jgi:dTDP-4-dehydrorhamnose 3,5-epimerase